MSLVINDFSLNDATFVALLFEQMVGKGTYPNTLSLNVSPTSKFLVKVVSYLEEMGYALENEFTYSSSFGKLPKDFFQNIGLDRGGMRLLVFHNESIKDVLVLKLKSFEVDINHTSLPTTTGLLHEISNILWKNRRRVKELPPTPTFSLVVTDDFGKLHTRSVALDWDPFTDEELSVNYGKAFYESQLALEEKLFSSSNGIFLLHGVTGSGKSSYIKHLISKYHSDEQIIYFPPECVNKLGDPSFIPFLLNNRNSIILLEDAENVLQHADDERRSAATTNLLNLTDGLLADVLNVKVIATFNCQHDEIDAALLRPGRLKYRWHFDKLTREEGTCFLNHHNIPYTVDESKSLAELYEIKENYGMLE